MNKGLRGAAVAAILLGLAIVMWWTWPSSERRPQVEEEPPVTEAPPPMVLELPPEPAPVIAPADIAFVAERLELSSRWTDETAPGSTSGRLTLVNRGGTPGQVIDAIVSGSGAFQVDRQACAEIAAGATCDLTVSFSPTGPGSFSAEVIVVTDSADRTIRAALVGEAQNIMPAPPPAAAPPPPADPVAMAVRAAIMERQQANAGHPQDESGLMLDGFVYRERPAAVPPAEPPFQTDYGGYPSATSSYPVRSSRILTTGNPIPAILISSIDTDIPGPVYAQVERHVYAADGQTILIPAFSRLVGYSNFREASATSDRVPISWNRIIRPDGAHILIAAPAADEMGRLGVIGNVDNRILNRLLLTTAITALNVGNAAASEILARRNGDSETIRIVQDRSTNELTLLGRELIEELIRTNRKVTVAQGSRFKVLPTVDIVLKELLVPAGGAVAALEPADDSGAGAQAAATDPQWVGGPPINQSPPAPTGG